MKKAIVILCTAVLSLMFFSSNVFAAKLSDDKLAKKTEGWYFSGLPLINYTGDDGLGFGARVYYFDNGSKEDPYWDSTPYFTSIYLQFYMTTKGYHYHEINADMPYFMKSTFRVKAYVAADIKQNATYYGQGADASDRGLVHYMNPEGTKYAEWDNWTDYQNDFSKEENSKYNMYKLFSPKAGINVYPEITDSIKALIGYEFKLAKMEYWGGEKFEVDDKTYTMNNTLVEQMQPEGWDADWDRVAILRLGVGYDTRDFEPDPSSGYYVDYALEGSHLATGSSFDFIRNTVAGRYYFPVLSPSPASLFPNSLVAAARVAYTTAHGDIPFFEKGKFGYALNRDDGLGGNRSLRGYATNRLVGNTMTLANLELRWGFLDFNVSSENFVLKLVGFGEAGNVYDNSGDLFTDFRGTEYKWSAGGGLVIAWNQATIIHFTYAQCPEGSNISIDFDHSLK